MTPEQVTKWAHEAGFDVYDAETLQVIQTFSIIVRNATLEEAAVKCEKLGWQNSGYALIEVRQGIASCAKEIRGLKT
jgi:hypothetical protein